MFLDPRFLTNATMIAAPTLMFLAASSVLLLMTGPGTARSQELQRVEIRGGESVTVPGSNGRPITLRFARVIADGYCVARAGCPRAGSPVVEVEAVGAGTPTFRMSPAAHLAAPFVPIQGRFVAFGELVSPPRELSTANRVPALEAYLLRLTVTP
jgi:hypothetical protein